MIKHANEKEFESMIKKDKVLVDFFATWCGPCKMLSLVMDKIDKKNIIPIIKVDIDEESNLAEKYGITAVPTLIIFENNKEVKRKTGFMSEEELERWVFE